MRIAVLGAGISGISAAKIALKLGHEVFIVEKRETPGGLMARIANCRVGFSSFFDEIKRNPHLKLILGRSVVSCIRLGDSFLLILDNGDSIHAERIILALGASLYEPEIRGKRIFSSFDYDQLIDQKNEVVPPDLRKIAFFLCVGSRNREFPLCSSVCCSYTLRQIKWTLMRANPEIVVFYNDFRLFGQEYFLKRLLENGKVRFIRTNSRYFEEKGNYVRVRYFTDGKIFEENFDYVILTNALRPPEDLPELSKIFGFSLNEYGFVKERKPLMTDIPGIYTCGCSLEPMNIKDSILTGYAAGFLAGGGIAGKNEKIHKLAANPEIVLDMKGDSYLFYLGTSEHSFEMFYEYFSHKFVDLAIKLKEKGKNVFFLTRNLVLPSYGEALYQKARESGVIFFHLEPHEDFQGNGKVFKVRGFELKIDHAIFMDDLCKDLLNLEILGFYRSEPQLRWSPTMWSKDRFHVGFLRYPRDERWEMREYYASFSEMLLESSKIDLPQVVEERCSGCGSCKESCPQSAVEILRKDKRLHVFGPVFSTTEPKARINHEICLGCGYCASLCPSNAIEFPLRELPGTENSFKKIREEV